MSLEALLPGPAKNVTFLAGAASRACKNPPFPSRAWEREAYSQIVPRSQLSTTMLTWRPYERKHRCWVLLWLSNGLSVLPAVSSVPILGGKRGKDGNRCRQLFHSEDQHGIARIRR